MILRRGSNVLCERYVTIWPTIRYLIHKKIVQFNILKNYENRIFHRKTN